MGDTGGQLQWVPGVPGLDLTSLHLKASFCAAVQGKRILLVGDSVMEQVFASISHILGVADAEPFPEKENDGHVRKVALLSETCADWLAVDRPIFEFVPNEHLALDGRRLDRRHRSGPLDWLPSVMEHPDIIVVNSGRWPMFNMEGPQRAHEKAIRATLAWLRSNVPPSTMLYVMSTKLDPQEKGGVKAGATSNCESTEKHEAVNPGIQEKNDVIKNMILNEFPAVKFLDFSCLDLKGHREQSYSCMPGQVDYRSLLFMAKYVADQAYAANRALIG